MSYFFSFYILHFFFTYAMFTLMKEKFYIYLCLMVLLTGCAANKKSETTSSSDLASIIQEVQSLPDAEINIPNALVGNEITEENAVLITEADEETNEESSKSTSTYSISGEERTNIVNGLSQDIIDGINKILSNREQYSNIVSITPNEDCTEFTISVKNGEINIYESMLIMSFYTMGDKYQIYNGVPEEEVKTIVRYINASTGEIIVESDSTQMNTN